MTPADITNLIANMGFPIAVCVICFWYIAKKDNIHREETAKLAEALNNNTLVMQRLVDKLDKE